jgi:hypothetical protein
MAYASAEPPSVRFWTLAGSELPTPGRDSRDAGIGGLDDSIARVVDDKCIVATIRRPALCRAHWLQLILAARPEYGHASCVPGVPIGRRTANWKVQSRHCE